MKNALVALGVSILVTLLYFRGFLREEVPFRPVEAAENALVMLGGPFSFGRLPVAAIAMVGSGLVVIFLIGAWRRRGEIGSDPAWWFGCFVIGSACLAGLGRIGWGSEYMVQDRYSPYGLLLAVLVWMRAPQFTIQPLFLASACLVTMVFNLHSYARIYPRMLEEKRWIDSVTVNSRSGGSFAFEAWGQNREQQVRALGEGVVRFGDLPLQAVPDREWIDALAKQDFPIATTFRFRKDDARGVFLAEPADSRVEVPPAPFVVLVGPSQPLLLPGIAERDTAAGLIRFRRLIKPSVIGYRWPFEAPPAGALRLIGVAPSTSNTGWSVLWSAAIALDAN